MPGGCLRRIADQTAAAVDTYVFRLVIDASVLSHVPEVREAAAAASQRPFDRAAVQATDRDWRRAGAAVPEKTAVIDNKVSAFLADTIRQNPIYRELILTDRFGRLVAASGATDAYLFDQAAWWPGSFGDGSRGRLDVSDVRLDPGTRTYLMGISAPVEDQTGGQLAGILHTVVDMREIGAVLGGVRMGATGDAVLVRQDGSIVYALGIVDPNARFFATDLLRERLAAAKKEKPEAAMQFAASGPGGGSRLVGVALSQLNASFPQPGLDRGGVAGRGRTVQAGALREHLAPHCHRPDGLGRAALRVVVLDQPGPAARARGDGHAPGPPPPAPPDRGAGGGGGGGGAARANGEREGVTRAVAAAAHSARRATTGSTRVARRAGTSTATSETAATMAATAP